MKRLLSRIAMTWDFWRTMDYDGCPVSLRNAWKYASDLDEAWHREAR